MLFPPEFINSLKDLLHQSPENFGIERSRWTLALIKDRYAELATLTIQGVFYILKRLYISYKQGRRHVHSPDPEYEAKKQKIDRVVRLARDHPGKVVTLFADEMSYTRYPNPARCWYEKGKDQPLALEVGKSNYKNRILAGLDVVTGRVLRRFAPKMGTAELVRFMKQIRKAYPGARKIFVIWDNWPMHTIEAVTQAAHEHGVNLVFQPIYAPWLNAVEKLWKKLRQEVLHMHRLADDWRALSKRVRQFFEPLKRGEHLDLLRYVGLLPD